MSELLSRRQLMKGGGMIAVGLVAPRWLSTIAQADVLKLAKGGKPSSDTVLVVCQFSGGNDGLNMVVPYADKNYYTLRPTLGIPENQVLKLNDSMGLHPQLAGLQTLYSEGKVAIIQNVGYPNPNRSHFESMRIWQSASPENTLKYGWVGRHFDQQSALGPLNPVVALGLSREQPLALAGAKVSIPCFASLQDVRSLVGDPDTEAMLRQIQSSGNMENHNPGTDVVRKASNSALDALSILNKQVATFKPQQQYANDAFGQGFKQISQLIGASPATRVVYFSAGGFDTHANQLASHQRLYKGFGDAVLAFQREMEQIGKADKVVLLVFSEFGRRAMENGSGTDHGKAAPMFVIGKNVKGGFHGSNPDLVNLDGGDLNHNIDFRQVYAMAVDEWMGGDSEVVLGQRFEHMPILKV
jgi:uncharacterized protein (DUF1501 family)